MEISAFSILDCLQNIIMEPHSLVEKNFLRLWQLYKVRKILRKQWKGCKKEALHETN